MLKIQQIFKSERHNVFTDKVNKIALSSNDDKNNAINWLIRTTFIWNKQKSSKSKRRD